MCFVRAHKGEDADEEEGFDAAAATTFGDRAETEPPAGHGATPTAPQLGNDSELVEAVTVLGWHGDVGLPRVEPAFRKRMTAVPSISGCIVNAFNGI